MDENLEIYFCEICSESIPAKDVDTKTALALKGKVIGACCLSEIRPAAVRAGSSSVGLTALGAILLAGVAAATIFIDSRLTSDFGALREEMGAVKLDVRSQGTMWADLEKRFDAAAVAQGTALDKVEKSLLARHKQLALLIDHTGNAVKGTKTQIEGLMESQSIMIRAQNTIREEIKDVETELLRLERDVASAVAAPRRMAADSEADGRGVVKPADVGGRGVDPALPPALAHQIARLKDKDAGNRFEAVDQLVISKNPAAQRYLLPMLKDSDAFVRRLTAEGLASFKQKTTVDALLVALADPESIVRHTTHASLKKLTGQNIQFNPDGSNTARAASQRRWKEWWKKNREKF